MKTHKFISMDIGTTTACFYSNCSNEKTFTLNTSQLFDLKKKKIKNKAINILGQFNAKNIYITGIGSDTIKKNSGILKDIFGNDLAIKYICEIQAIANGSINHINKIKSKKINNALIASCGTGLCIVNYNKGKIIHCGGSGICGGTIMGLLHLLLKRKIAIKDITNFQTCKYENYNHKMDFVLGDFSNQVIGNIPIDATISNMANINFEKYTESEIICSVLNLVGENIAACVNLALKNAKTKNIIFTGNVIKFSFIQSVLKKYLSEFDLYFANDDFVVAKGCIIQIPNNTKKS